MPATPEVVVAPASAPPAALVDACVELVDPPLPWTGPAPPHATKSSSASADLGVVIAARW